MPVLEAKAEEWKGASSSIFVGRDVLELLSSAMYTDPLCIYREYVQNSADAIDDAQHAKLYTGTARGQIEISINHDDRSARIRDNGAGCSAEVFERTLTAIGGSKKRGTTARGFRGVGRLAGLAYCEELIMRSKSSGDAAVSVMRWDCKKFKELLRENQEATIEDVISQIVTHRTEPAKALPAHFFEVELKRLIGFRGDLLLNEAAIANYLGQIGPVPFSPAFTFGPQIDKFLSEFNAGKAYPILINGKTVFRPLLDCFEVRKGVASKFTKLDVYQIPGVGDDTAAVGWLLHSEYLGAIPERFGIGGLRIRAGNIQIGDSRLLESLFSEPRFNAWAVGECHVISPRLLPNGRRDDFEQNTQYTNLRNRLTVLAKDILKACRTSSAQRTRAKQGQNIPTTADINWAQAKRFLSAAGTKKLPSKVREKIKLLLRRKPPATYLDLASFLLNNGGVKPKR
jgi:hypothetical protein